MKKPMVSILVFALVFSIGFFSVDNTEARPICITKQVDKICCVAVGWLMAEYCCVAPGGEYLDCEIRIVRDKKTCVPGVPLC